MGTRVVVVSDTHLSTHAPEARANWDAVVAHVADVRPELVIHLGDLTLDGARSAVDLQYARGALDELPAPWLAVPGNHDVGDDASSPDAAAGALIDDDRRQRWLDTIGADYWSVEIGGRVVLGVNAQLFGTGLTAEDEQWTWLEQEVARHAPQRPLAFITHKPVFARDEELATAPTYRFVREPARQRLASLLGTGRWELALSGHVHQHRRLADATTEHVWAPTAWAVLPEALQATVGTKRCGVVSVMFDGDSSPAVEIVEPDGLCQYVLGENMPDPYAHA
jgi:3',5'-cyclic AMP phosphodiesterase CpdA